MAELRFVDRAAYSPTQCALCLSFEGPFVDTAVEFLGYGHVYICASNENRSGCIRQMARFDGMVERAEIEFTLDELERANRRVEELGKQLEESRVVPMDEVVAYLSRPREPVVIGKELDDGNP